MYNLGFGDWEDGDSGFDDFAVTGNGDMEWCYQRLSESQ